MEMSDKNLSSTETEDVLCCDTSTIADDDFARIAYAQHTLTSFIKPSQAHIDEILNNRKEQLLGSQEELDYEADSDEDDINVVIDNAAMVTNLPMFNRFSPEIEKLLLDSINTKSTDVLLFFGKYITIKPSTLLSNELLETLFLTNSYKTTDTLRDLNTLEPVKLSPRMYFTAQYLSVAKSRYFTNFAAICVEKSGSLAIYTDVESIKDAASRYDNIYIIRNEFLDTFLSWPQNPFGNLLDKGISHTFDAKINTIGFCIKSNPACALCTALKMLITDMKISESPHQMFDVPNNTKEYELYVADTINIHKYDFSVMFRGGVLPIILGHPMSDCFAEDILESIPISKGKVLNMENRWNKDAPIIALGIEIKRGKNGYNIASLSMIFCSKSTVFTCTNMASIKNLLDQYPHTKVYYSYGYAQKKFVEWASMVIPRLHGALQVQIKEYNVSAFCSGIFDKCATCNALMLIITLINNSSIQAYRDVAYNLPRSNRQHRRYMPSPYRGCVRNRNNKFRPY